VGQQPIYSPVSKHVPAQIPLQLLPLQLAEVAGIQRKIIRMIPTRLFKKIYFHSSIDRRRHHNQLKKKANFVLIL
jgi:hypothetical protein